MEQDAVVFQVLGYVIHNQGHVVGNVGAGVEVEGRKGGREKRREGGDVTRPVRGTPTGLYPFAFSRLLCLEMTGLRRAGRLMDASRDAACCILHIARDEVRAWGCSLRTHTRTAVDDRAGSEER